MFTHLHGHSHYSLLEAIGHPKDIAQEAKDLGMSAITLTDYNGLYGAIEFYKAAKSLEIKPILGCELGFTYNINLKDKHEDCGTIVLLATSYDDYQALLRLVSTANLDGRHNEKARIDIETLQHHTQHHSFIALIGGTDSFVAKMINKKETDSKIRERISQLRDLVGKENLIIELLVQDEQAHPTVNALNKTLSTIATDLELSITCSNNFHYIDQEDQKASEVALAIKDGKRMFDEDRRKVSLAQHIMSEKEVRKIMQDNGYDATQINHRIENSAMIAERINIDIPLGQILFPKYESPDHIKQLYDTNKAHLIQSNQS